MTKSLIAAILLSSTIAQAATTTTTSATVTYNDDGSISIALNIAGSNPISVEVPALEPAQPAPASPDAQPIDPPPEASPDSPSGESPAYCLAEGSTLQAATNAYASQCSQPRKDCDPLNGQWYCASVNIESIQDLAVVTPPASPAPAPVVNPVAPTNSSSGVTNSLIAEAESATLTNGWQFKSTISGYSGQGYIEWSGGNRFSKVGDGILRYTFNVPVGGIYQFNALTRVTGSNKTENNDVWIQFPTGQNVSGKQPLSGFEKVFQSKLSAWNTSLSVDNGDGNRGAVFQHFSAGNHELLVSGRSNGFIIDQFSLELVSKQASSPPVQSNNGAMGLLGSKDLLSIHYDNAPDRDDGHALVAGRVIADTYGLQPHVVNGTYGHQRRNDFQTASESVFSAAWPSGLNAYRDRDGSVATTASLWISTATNGGKIWVADGGPMDFTADVLRAMPADLRKNVFVIQHSTGWNVNNTSVANRAYVRNAANYKTIGDGNTPNNGTADFNNKSASFVTKALDSQWGALWTRAFSYLNPNSKLDFSDTVELLYILSVPVSQVSSVDDFAREYF